MTATGCITLNSRPSDPRFPATMNVSKRGNVRLLASGLLLLATFSSIGSFGHAAVSLPVQHDSLALTVNPDRSVGVAWNTISSLAGTPLAHRTAFETAWGHTFGIMSWTRMIAQQIQNATLHFVTVTAFNGTVTYPTATSASVSIGFAAVPSQPGTDFVTVLENILSPYGGTGLDPIIRAALNLQTGETVNLTYNG